MTNLTLEGKIKDFKTLVLPKIVRLCVTSLVPKQIIEDIENIQKNVFWNHSTSKTKHSTLCDSFTTGGLIASLQCSGIKRLNDDSFHEWQINLINTTITPAFKFHPHLTLSL